MSQQNKIKNFDLFDNFQIPKVSKTKKIDNYFSNFKDLYKFEKEYFKSENDNDLTGFSYVDLLKRGFDIFNNNTESYYGYYNGNSKFNVEFQKAKENYDYFNEFINNQNQEYNEQDYKQNEIKQDLKEVDNDTNKS